MVNMLCRLRQATRQRDAAVAARRRSCALQPRSQRQRRRDEPERRRAPMATREAERQRLAVPAGDQQAAHALDQIGDRVPRRDRRGTSRSGSGCGAGCIEDRKSRTKNSGNRPWTASPEPVRSAAAQPIAPNPSVDQDDSARITEHAADARGEVGAGGQADERGTSPPGEPERPGRRASMPASSAAPAQRRQREPVEEAGLDVGGEVGARVHQRRTARPG